MSIKYCCTIKVLLSIVFAYLTFGNPVSAQILIGPKMGVQASRITLNEDTDKNRYQIDPVIGFNGGITTAIRVQKRFFLHVDLLYSRKGKKLTGKLDNQLRMDAVNHYFEMPIIYRIDFNANVAGTSFKWYAGLGPNVSYWWKGNGTLASSELDEQDIAELDYTINFDYDPSFPSETEIYVEDPNRIQLGLNLETGMVFEPYGTSQIILGLRLELGHSYLAKSERGRLQRTLDFSDPLRARTQNLSLSVAWLWDTKVAERKRGKSTFKK